MRSMEMSQYTHIQDFDEGRELLEHLKRVNPSSKAVEMQKKVVFDSYYNATRSVTRDEHYVLKIEKDQEIIDILSKI